MAQLLAPELSSQLTFEQALKELESLIHQLEDGRTTLEQAVIAYEKGHALKKYCEQKLREARTRIEKVTLDTEKETIYLKACPVETRE